ncbi:MAG TPA: condensation domain-containing protein, partial [Thermoanaerobaculia bacterium]|nr:condensation domain-containing protein [Thermoanaerobaculia bacterium]
MTDLRQRIAQLDPERLELLLRLERPPAGSSAAPTIVPREDRSQAPLSFLQRRLWFLDRLEAGSPLYNMHAAYRVRGGLDLRTLGASFAEALRRHEVLRARFEDDGGEPVQRIEALAAVTLPLVDLAALPEESQGAEAERLVLAAARWPFDLSRAPLLRVVLVRTAASDHRISVALHHVVSDGWSIGVLIAEFEALYGAFARGL